MLEIPALWANALLPVIIVGALIVLVVMAFRRR